MRKLYNEFFYVPKHGKVREKVMLTHVVMVVTVILICLAAMSFTAYAYFSCGVTSYANIIQSASFEAKVQIVGANGEPVEVITGDYQSQSAELKANAEYSVTLQHTDRSTAKNGFMIITATNCDGKYHTQQLGKDANGNTETVTFWLKPTADTVVTFTPCWGTSSRYSDFMNTKESSELYITSSEHLTIMVKTENEVQSNDASGAESEAIAPAEQATEVPVT
ncbi:MAG: hypothetical protein IJ426_00315 [Clostridia bacterium]|nr:hypothetical protein [Clostridia bacterium]